MRLKSSVVMSMVALAGAVAPSVPASADERGADRVTVAVIGDVPYGEAQESSFGLLIEAINRDAKVRSVVHVGDTKSGSTACTDDRLLTARNALDTFRDPVVYTPGDNEWTDCHRPAAGGYDPLERLAFLRSAYFPRPGMTLGRRPSRVVAQPELVENVRWTQSRVVFAALHVVGSNNGLAPWTGNAEPTVAQHQEVAARVAATVEWVHATFDVAAHDGSVGVVLAMQADTFPAPGSGQRAVVEAIAARAASFDGEVLLLQGDSHRYLVDHPLPHENVTRIVVHGETLPFEYLRLTIDSRATYPFSWERIPVPA